MWRNGGICGERMLPFLCFCVPLKQKGRHGEKE